MILDKKLVTKTWYDFNQSIRKYYANYYIMSDCKSVYYGFNAGDCKSPLYLNTCGFIYNGVNDVFPDLMDYSYIYGDDFNKACKDKCTKLVREDGLLLMSDGKSGETFTIGKEMKESDARLVNKNYDTRCNNFLENEKCYLFSNKLSKDDIEAILEYKHLKFLLGNDKDKPVYIYLSAQLFPALKKLNDVRFNVYKVSDVLYDVTIRSSADWYGMISRYRIVNIY